VWEAAIAAGEAVVDVARVERGLAEALRVGETIYARDAAAVTPPQRRVLLAIARESTTTATAAGYIARQQLPAKSTVAQALGSLIEKGYVEAIGDLAVVSDPLFAEWLRRQ
jgi:DNA-binding MarR family transcriptional regulator